MKTLLTVLTLVALTAGSASAVLNLHIAADGSGTITGQSDIIDGYTITSASGALVPAAWSSISALAMADPTIPGLIGPGAYSFGPLTTGPGQISDGNLSFNVTIVPAASLAVGAAGFRADVGLAALLADMTFTYINTADGLGQLPGTITPEPATMSLLALGGLAMLRRRR